MFKKEKERGREGRQGGRKETKFSCILKWRLHAKTWISSSEQLGESVQALLTQEAATSYGWVMETPAIFFKQTWSLAPRPLYPQNISASCLLCSYLPVWPHRHLLVWQSLVTAVHWIPFLFPPYHTKSHLPSSLAVRCHRRDWALANGIWV